VLCDVARARVSAPRSCKASGACNSGHDCHVEEHVLCPRGMDECGGKRNIDWLGWVYVGTSAKPLLLTFLLANK
jgi:hypothetical protein